jgi:hypothetical protein
MGPEDAPTDVVCTGQTSFTCPEAGDAAYGNKPTLDLLNDAACAMDDTYLFTSLVQDETVSPFCTTYCASCEEGVCGNDGNGRVTCSDPSKCTLCSDPPGCETTSSATQTKMSIIITMWAAVVVVMASAL